MKYQKNNKKRKRSESESKSESSTGGGSRRIKEGDNVEISRLLSSKDRDHLVSCVHGMEVKVRVAELKGNVLAVVFVSLSSKVGELDEVKALARICKELGDRSCAFKVVFIATGDKCHFSEDLEGRFWYFLSYMPWLAIQYTDKESRQRLQRQFGFSNHTLSQTILFDPRGLVLSTNAASCFHSFGAEGYPFTSERILEIYSQEEELAKNPSLERLLVSPIHTCVIKNTREEVPISSLEEKVVCLYLYEDGVTTDELTEKLKYAYLELRQRGKDFEIVLVYISSTTSVCDYVNEDSFWERFKTMPWLALPFKDPRCEKVARVFNYPDELGGPDPVPTMVIIGPCGSCVEFYGADILVEYGISAYPFTREQAAKREIEKLRGVTLDSLLDPGVVLGAKDGSQRWLTGLCLGSRREEGLAFGSRKIVLQI